MSEQQPKSLSTAVDVYKLDPDLVKKAFEESRESIRLDAELGLNKPQPLIDTQQEIEKLNLEIFKINSRLW